MFGKATIRLGIGPHSSFILFMVALCFDLCRRQYVPLTWNYRAADV